MFALPFQKELPGAIFYTSSVRVSRATRMSWVRSCGECSTRQAVRARGRGGMSSLLDVEGVQVMAIMPLSQAADSVRGVLNTMAALW